MYYFIGYVVHYNNCRPSEHKHKVLYIEETPDKVLEDFILSKTTYMVYKVDIMTFDRV